VTRGRLLLLIAALAGWVAGAVFSMGPPKLSLVNAGLTVAYPTARGLSALAGAVALALALLVRIRWVQVVAAVLAVATAAVGLHILRYRVVADASGLTTRSLASTRFLRWSAVARVEAGPGLVLLTSGDGFRVRVDTTDFSADQRAALDRTIARRLREGDRSATGR
jgi:PH (Pleckstrin Homology) domain-containing protein